MGEATTVLLLRTVNVFSLKTIAKIISKAALPSLLLPLYSEKPTSPGEEIGQTDGEDLPIISCDSWWWWLRTNQPSSPSCEMTDDEKEKKKQVRRLVYITISMAKLISTLLALITSYAIFVHTQGSPLALELSHR